jgi:TonB family protein
MFSNLIESDSHRKEFKVRSLFFLATVAAYAVILFAAGIASIYAYDARLEAQRSTLELLNWVPPVTPAAQPPRENQPRPVHRSTPSNAPIDRTARVQERTIAMAPTTDPRSVPAQVGTRAIEVPPVTGLFRISTRNVDPPASVAPGGCGTCTGNETSSTRVPGTTKPPDPPVLKPKTETLPARVLVSRAISLPQPPYPPLARQIHVQGSVPVQILVDESGGVISAHAVSGHAFLTRAAEEAALRARFTPTTLNGQAVKVQGVITYNFVLE